MAPFNGDIDFPSTPSSYTSKCSTPAPQPPPSRSSPSPSSSQRYASSQNAEVGSSSGFDCSSSEFFNPRSPVDIHEDYLGRLYSSSDNALSNTGTGPSHWQDQHSDITEGTLANEPLHSSTPAKETVARVETETEVEEEGSLQLDDTNISRKFEESEDTAIGRGPAQASPSSTLSLAGSFQNTEASASEVSLPLLRRSSS